MPLFRKKKQQKGAKRVILKRDSISDDEDEVYVQARMSGKDLIFDLCNCQYDEHGKAELWTQIVYCLCINHKVTIVKRVFSEESLKEYRQLKDCTFSKFEDYALIGPRKLNREELNEFLGLQNKFNDFSTSSIWVNFEKGDKSFAKVDLFSKLFDPLMRGRKPDNDHDLPCIGVINDGDWLVWHKFTDCMQKIPFTINNAAAVTESELCEIYESDKPERLLEIFLGKSIESNDSGTSCSTKPMGNVSCSTSIDNFVDAASTWSSDLFNSNSSSLFRQESQPLTKHDFLSKIIMLEERNKLVGHGAYSEVYRISDSERPMAVKIFRASGNGRSAIKKLFENEVLTLKKLKHNFIIKYLDFVTMNLDMGYQFAIFMEFAEHGTLAQLIFSSKYSYSMYTVICWMEQLFDVLDYLEGNQILHRDIKPENIFLDQRYFLKLGDFGHAKIAPVVDESRAISESYAGTERYMSPECLFLAPQVTTGTDLYSLGIVLWEVIERRRLFEKYRNGHNFAAATFRLDLQRHQDLTKMERLNCNELIRRIILSCTSYDCKKRPRAFEMLQQTITIRKMYEQLSPLLPFKPTNDENLVEPSSPIGIKAKIDENCATKKQLAFDCDLLDYLITDIEKSEAVKIAEMLASRILFPEQELENVQNETDVFSRVQANWKTSKNLKKWVGQNEPQGIFYRNPQSSRYQEVFKSWVNYKGMIECLSEAKQILQFSFDIDIDYIDEFFSMLIKPLSHFESTTSKEAFILVEEENYRKDRKYRNSSIARFVPKKDLHRVQVFRGQWLNLEHFEVKSECQEKAETFVFTNKRPLCFDYLDFDANLRFDQIISYFEGLISQEQGHELPVKGYIYHLSYPPRAFCACEYNCPLVEYNEILPLGFEQLRLRYPICCQNYSKYALMFFYFSDLLIKLQELSNFVDLARAISSAGVLLMLISSLECPKYFLMRKLKDSRIILDVLLQADEKPSSKRVLLMTKELKISEESISKSDFDEATLHILDLEEFLSQDFICKVFENFREKCIKEHALCPFLKTLQIKEFEINNIMEEAKRLCNDFFELPVLLVVSLCNIKNKKRSLHGEFLVQLASSIKEMRTKNAENKKLIKESKTLQEKAFTLPCYFTFDDAPGLPALFFEVTSSLYKRAAINSKNESEAPVRTESHEMSLHFPSLKFEVQFRKEQSI